MRYLPLKDDDRQQMLDTIGVTHVDDLFSDVPEAVLNAEIDLPDHQSEWAVEAFMRQRAQQNLSGGDGPFFLGAGAYRHHVPASVDHLIQRGEFLTAYTPYQPEIAQGTLQYIFEFQTQVAELTGMDVANASLYDGSTATAEAVMMASRVTRRRKALLSGNLHPHYSAVVQTMTKYRDEVIDILPASPDVGHQQITAVLDRVDDSYSCVVIQNPDVFGHVADLTPLADALHEKGVLLVVVVTEAVSLGLMKRPGQMGADIVVGEGQSIGNGLNFGGPYLGLFATRQKYVRQMPGRLCGETVDSEGRRGFVLTLSTREQHIRREKATSNICTNSGLCALAFTIHMALLGDRGLDHLARLCHQNTRRLVKALSGFKGVEILNDAFFNEITVRLPKEASLVVETLADHNIMAGIPAQRLHPELPGDLLILAATELTSEEDIEHLVDGLREVLE